MTKNKKKTPTKKKSAKRRSTSSQHSNDPKDGEPKPSSSTQYGEPMAETEQAPAGTAETETSGPGISDTETTMSATTELGTSMTDTAEPGTSLPGTADSETWPDVAGITVTEISKPGTKSELMDLDSPLGEPHPLLLKACQSLQQLAAQLEERFKLPPHLRSMDCVQEKVEMAEDIVTDLRQYIETIKPQVALPRPQSPAVLSFGGFAVKWPKIRTRVPHVFLHRPADFQTHAREFLARNIKMYYPRVGFHHAKILCQSFEDHAELVKYLNEKEIPYHTFGHPEDRVVKAVVRGLSNNTDTERVRQEMVKFFPVIRFHEMNAKRERKGKRAVVVVVPNTEQGRTLLSLKTVYGEPVTVEPPRGKNNQCHRCQRWGHSQRYCRGVFRCVKCAEEHATSECTRDPEEDPCRCANCAGEHTANHRQCEHCPYSYAYRREQDKLFSRKVQREVLTYDNCPKH